MGINKQSDIEANLQIGPTDIGMVRITYQLVKLKFQWILILRKLKKLPKKLN